MFSGFPSRYWDSEMGPFGSRSRRGRDAEQNY